MVFSLIGNISERAFMDTMERHFGSIAANRRGFNRQTPAPVGKFSKVVGRSTHQLHCILGRRAYGYNDDRRIALSLLMNIMGGPSANSLLNVLLREKNALSYGVEASGTTFSDTGIASIYFTCERDKGEKCVELINNQIAELQLSQLSPRRLSVAKKQFLGQFAISSENNENYMLGAGKSLLVFGKVESADTVREKILSLTAEEIRETACNILSDMSMLMYK
jgi:predicted Zn-dependent peptidase